MADFFVEFKPKQMFAARGIQMGLPDYIWFKRHRQVYPSMVRIGNQIVLPNREIL
jgi:hypothetical protein